MFRKKSFSPPIPDWDRQWMEDSFRWIVREFPNYNSHPPNVLLPTDFIFEYVSNEQLTTKISSVITKNIMITDDETEYLFFEKGTKVFNNGSPFPIFSIPVDTVNYAGLYCGKNEKGKYVIALNTNVFTDENVLVGTIARELSRIVLIELIQLDEFDEYLIDLMTIFCGCGTFSANAAFSFYKDFYVTGYHKLGLLTENQWTYALALFASIRDEDKPSWLPFLKDHFRAGVLDSLTYIRKNLSPIWYLT